MKFVKRVFMLCLLLFIGSSTAFSVNYPKVFGDDWTSAVQYVNAHHAAWKPLFEAFDVNARLAEAIVFPELIRYSRWQDEIETAAVNGLYVLQGVSGANFSIGRFQMKPSFAEEVEVAWNQSALAKEYGFVFNLQDGAEARRSRIRRLSTDQGQCRYLAIFIRLQQLRHPELSHLSADQQVRYLATAYNRSFSASWQMLSQMQHECHYHTDIVKTSFTRMYCYADIAASFY